MFKRPCGASETFFLDKDSNMKQISLETNHLNFTIPEKRDSKYVSYISVDVDGKNEPLFLQTPIVKIQVTPELDSVCLTSPVVSQKIKELEDFVKNHIADNTPRFFNGKKFSRQKIVDSFDTLNLENIPIGDDMTFQDQFENTLSKCDLDFSKTIDSVLLLYITGIEFTKKNFRMACVIKQAKIYMSNTKASLCVLLDDTDIPVKQETLSHETTENNDDGDDLFEQ
jgi:hypothetical protein